MNVDIKLSGELYAEMLRDLQRAHPFAAERAGFGFGRMSSGAAGVALILLTRYHAIPDSHYVRDRTVGARIGPNAMTWAMQAVHAGRPSREGIFHVHLHAHRGETGMSVTDQRELPRLIPGFRSVSQGAPHGIVIFSLDHASGWVWLPHTNEPVSARSVAVAGAPVRVFDRGVDG